MVVHRGFRYKLAPTPEQETLFRQFAGVCRLVYNLALEQRRDWFRHFKENTGFHISFASQCRELTKLRAEFDWVAAVPCVVQEQALRDLDKAYDRFFSGVSSYPTPRKKHMDETFRFKGREVSIKRINSRWAAVRVPKVGWIKFRDTRPVRGEVKTATINLSAKGWHIAFACEIEHTTPANINPAVGIDRGVSNAVALSTGESFIAPISFRTIDRRRRAAQRTLARRKRGSKRYLKQRKRVEALHAKAGRIRKHWLHRISTEVASRFGTVVMEDLKVRSMTATAKGTVENPGRAIRQKAGLNRAILEQGWTMFADILEYKLVERGGHVVTVDPAYTSQTCSECGTIDIASRKSQASFICQHCGHRAHADVNAAINILRRNTAFMRMEEGHGLSVEVRTGTGYSPPENPTP